MHSWKPDEYEKSSEAQQLWAAELLSKVEIDGDERVLDIGSGDGKITAKVADLVPDGSVLGIDSSAAMVAFAAERHPQEEHANLSFQLGDARNLDFDGEFDLVVSFAALHWVGDHGPVLRGIRRALKPGGRAFLQFGGRGNAAGALAIADGIIKEDSWRRSFEGFDFRYAFFGPEEYRIWIEEAGLVPLRVELIQKDMVQPGPAGFAGWIESTWLPYLERVPEDRRREFISEIVGRYLRLHPPDGEGRVHVGMVRLEAVAERPGI
ncbi:methyltransferase domain-containing protein [Methanotrichaceae archaeon M04Ac]|uniref:Methyltransferase domain-containing protein n=1 Tax=Candidatus Methanocrinis alkalitolerans TaxID=3033395 RepID=A0ABT5XHL3_9EURY|nr:methyltransferase domain-containing protein [Candidatus Methanocrinis alkalitolerans]MDF0594118.1 methyltransferase domain-containing protein [Candidatus Methanocrinis alkalitolerans]